MAGGGGVGGINAVIIMGVIRELHTRDSQHICSAGIRTSYVLIEIQWHLVGELEINSVEAPAEAVPATSDCVLSVMKPEKEKTNN